VILVDEPTNHLDLEAREWLEAHLRERRGAMIAISHDRAFLDNATDFTLHLINGKLNRFQGAYTKFAKMWAEQKSQWEDQYQRQQEHIAKTEAFIRKNIAGQRTNQAKSRRKQLARLERMEAPPNEGQKLRLRIEPARPSGAVVLEAQGLTQRFDTLTLFEKLDFQVLAGDKIGVLGPNGTGKTSLLRILTREHVPAAGRLSFGTNVDLGYYDQDLRLVNDSNTVLREIHQMDPLMSEGDVRGMLGAFAFSGDMVDQEVRTLSGGERARLSLLKLILERHNFLLLDEPTNHLDTDTREALEEALVGYSGTLIVVSHDRYFLNRICNRIFAFESKAGGGTGGVRQFLGNYDDYRFRLQSEREARNAAAARAAAPTSAPKTTTAATRAPVPTAPAAETPRSTATATRPVEPVRDPASVGDRRMLSKNELRKVRQEVLDLEEEIELLESDIELAGEEMSSGNLSGEEMSRAAARVQKQQAVLDAKLARWEVLNALMERGDHD
jgi:ATP-binding cassette, subfamily F, member 3